MPAKLRANLLTLALGASGGILFAALNIPLPWLLGALLFTMVGSFSGLKLALDNRIRNPALTVLGVSIGAALTPDLLERARDWWLSLSAMALFVVVASPLAILYCRRVMGFDSTSATFAGIPGGLSEMVFTGSSLGGDARRIALAHTGRLAMVLILIAPAMQFFADIEVVGARPGFSPWATLPLVDLSVLLGCVFAGAVVGRLLRFPNPFLLGPLLLSAVAHLLGLTSAAPPNWLLDIVQLLAGAYVGAQFANTRLGELLRTLTLSTLLTFALLGLAGLFAWSLSQVAGLPLAAVLLAFVPGGIAEMCLIAILLQVDPIFVAAHHLFRVVMIMIASPLLATWIRRRAHGV